MKQRHLSKSPFLAGFILCLALLACALPGLPENGGVGVTPPLPAAGVVTANADVATYFSTLHSANLGPGERVPGTQLQYTNRNNNAYEILIDGLPALKRTGDSLPWTGFIAPGITGRFNLRLVPQPNDRLLATGTVNLTILEPFPVEANEAPDFTNALNYRNILWEQSVPAGQQIPGTSLFYVGQAPDGAELSGSERYPYYSDLDSIVWNGYLRDNVYVRQTLRVVRYDAESLRLVGTSIEIWVLRN